MFVYLTLSSHTNNGLLFSFDRNLLPVACSLAINTLTYCVIGVDLISGIECITDKSRSSGPINIKIKYENINRWPLQWVRCRLFSRQIRVLIVEAIFHSLCRLICNTIHRLLWLVLAPFLTACTKICFVRLALISVKIFQYTVKSIQSCMTLIMTKTIFFYLWCLSSDDKPEVF